MYSLPSHPPLTYPYLVCFPHFQLCSSVKSLNGLRQ